jgi:hypothetical protein
VRVEVARSGGFAGLTLRGTVDTATLPEPTAAAVAEALRDLPYGRPAAPAALPDRFRYEIAVTDHSGRRIAMLGEEQVPEVLREVLDAALQV